MKSVLPKLKEFGEEVPESTERNGVSSSKTKRNRVSEHK